MKRLLKGLLRKVVTHEKLRSVGALMRTAAIYSQPISLCEPEGGQIVVLAPHMDDETLGCGGTIARHVRAGAFVTTIFLTDGRHGSVMNEALSESERDLQERKVVATRKLEARRAGQVLGVQTTLFLDAEDGNLENDPFVAKRLREALERARPAIVYIPHFLERHPDHRAANDVLLAAVAGTSLDFECRGYEVWTPLFPNRAVAIDSTVELKKQALACYLSQLAIVDYMHSSLGLSAYRSATLGRHDARFAETFLALSLRDYQRYYRLVRRSS